jgi:hypothetical protein
VLAAMGLHLGMEVPDWPPENIEDLAKRYEDSVLHDPERSHDLRMGSCC